MSAWYSTPAPSTFPAYLLVVNLTQLKAAGSLVIPNPIPDHLAAGHPQENPALSPKPDTHRSPRQPRGTDFSLRRDSETVRWHH